MHDIKWIRDHPDEFDRGLERRGLAPQSAAILALDQSRREEVQKLQDAQARRNAVSRAVGEAMAAKDTCRSSTAQGRSGSAQADHSNG